MTRYIIRRAPPSAYGCRAIVLAVVVAPVVVFSAIYGLAEAIAHTWNPFA